MEFFILFPILIWVAGIALLFAVAISVNGLILATDLAKLLAEATITHPFLVAFAVIIAGAIIAYVIIASPA